MTKYEIYEKELLAKPQTWLVTGCAGFIGSHLIERLLNLNQKVIGVDNFSTGTKENLQVVEKTVGPNWAKFTFIEGDLKHTEVAQKATQGVDRVLHQAALGSVPRSIDKPRDTFDSNVLAAFNCLEACRNSKVKTFVYASSSSIYGDNENLPKKEEDVGKPLSPYAASKKADEVLAQSFSHVYNLRTVGLRYFNVFGPRQNPQGPYAAVIPKWLNLAIEDKELLVNGDGSTSRDFSYIENVVQANILAAMTESQESNAVYNVACGAATSLNQIITMLEEGLNKKIKRQYGPFRLGDVKHSQADINLIKKELGYETSIDVNSGMQKTIQDRLK